MGIFPVDGNFYPSSLIEIAIYFAVPYLLYKVYQKLSEQEDPSLPPAVPGAPLIGNLIDIIKATNVGRQHLLFEKYIE
jgi:hypothetical protein